MSQTKRESKRDELKRILRTLSGQLLFVTEYISDRTYGTEECRKLAADACARIAKDGHRLLRSLK